MRESIAIVQSEIMKILVKVVAVRLEHWGAGLNVQTE